MPDLQSMTLDQLDNEFERLVELRDDCQSSIAQIRNEKVARRDREIAELKLTLAAKE